jgi:uncharacterized protein YxeA
MKKRFGVVFIVVIIGIGIYVFTSVSTDKKPTDQIKTHANDSKSNKTAHQQKVEARGAKIAIQPESEKDSTNTSQPKDLKAPLEYIKECLSNSKSSNFTNDLEFRDWKVKNSYLSSQNLHVKKGPDIYRLRLFDDDSGTSAKTRRLVLFKEDETGFPQIVEISEKDSYENYDQVIEDYLNSSELIHQEQYYQLTTDRGEDIYIEIANGKLRRMDITTGDQLFECYIED